MKRALFETIKAMPYVAGQTIDCIGALSAVLGIHISAAEDNTTAKITVAHSETSDGIFTDVRDEYLFLNETQMARDAGGHCVQAYATVPVAVGMLVNMDVDLLSCKRFVKFNVTYTKAGGATATVTATNALALGDYRENPPAM